MSYGVYVPASRASGHACCIAITGAFSPGSGSGTRRDVAAPFWQSRPFFSTADLQSQGRSEIPRPADADCLYRPKYCFIDDKKKIHERFSTYLAIRVAIRCVLDWLSSPTNSFCLTNSTMHWKVRVRRKTITLVNTKVQE
jgi:hypothetical protein